MQRKLPRARSRKRKKSNLPVPPFPLPDVITLRAIGEELDVFYHPGESARTSAREQEGSLIISGNIGQQECVHALRRWTSRKARAHLPPWLGQISRELCLPFGRAALRKQRTRWASCSARHTVSINEKLLFVPALLVEYVFVHELCHTVELNHSPRFWRLVSRFEPDCKSIERQLRSAWRYVPWWMCEPGSGELNQSHWRERAAAAGG